ncbi:isochorismatase family protein [Ramlibacter albus]|uniref:Isochorismatase family protein n=1 Tax=Ramlibacter albus TaxID=2079448 RepID=A0A923S114_9BURK|nr:isochorismatase family protein [Ramlibacter albus]MBC5763820.1 isochorismatase family protein [Ramlibacter albus]
MDTGLTLLVIDPQNDFMDMPGAALPVAGAKADMARLAAFIDQAQSRIDAICVTLDTHHSVGIERPAMWVQGDGRDVAPFTQVSSADVRAGKYRPRRDGDLPRVLAYLDALEAGGRYSLMVWPVHCEVGTWGHNVEDELRAAYNRWEAARLVPVRHVMKGMNAWTENYSALQAEVPDAEDPETQLNTRLVAQLDRASTIAIAGEASSHCVRATTEHLVQHMPSRNAGKIVLLQDCMSPVAGFEAQAGEFLDAMRRKGVRVTTTAGLLRDVDA